MGDYAKAIFHFRKIIQMGVDLEAVSFNNLGVAYRERGQYKQAIQAFKKACLRDPKNRVFFNNYVLMKKYRNKINT